MSFNESKWVEIESVEGDRTGKKYFGRFYMKPHLTHGERADAVRLAEMYSRGIDKDIEMRQFLTTLAFLKFHIEETDSDWWGEANGLDFVDESPVYALAGKLKEIQDPDFGKTPPPSEPNVSPELTSGGNKTEEKKDEPKD